MSSRFRERVVRSAGGGLRRTDLALTVGFALALVGVVARDARSMHHQARPAAARATPSAPRVLRVCADPNNLPFSNTRGEGFENKIAEMLAGAMGARVEYTWWAQRRGFFRNTLNAGACDVVIGVPAEMEMALTTRPYYRSTYVFVTRADGPRVRSLDDPVLRRVRIGVQLIGDDGVNTPPAHALARRGIVRNVSGFPVYGDYAEANPPERIVRAVANGDVDVAAVWGPLAGYFATRERVPLRLTPVAPAVDPPAMRFQFAIAMGVRKRDRALRDELDSLVARLQPRIDRVLHDYGVPRADARVGARAGE